jgi:glycosyltransferase involved in cell wall biosynthesis
MPRIGIVVPAYNAAGYLHTSLTSLLELDYPASLLDLVVVNDGSADQTRAHAKDLLANAPFSWRVLDLDDRGPSAARNLGWRQVRGDWIQFLDADDFLAPPKLVTQGRAALGLDQAAAVIFSPWQRVNADAARGSVSRPHIGGDTICDLLKTENFMQLGSQLFRRTWLERVGGFDNSLIKVEDVELALRIAIAGGKFLEAPSAEPLAFYCARSGSLSGRDRVGFVNACVRNAKLAEAYWRAAGSVDGERRDVLLRVYGIALRFFAQHDRSKFIALWQHVQNLDPHYRPEAGLARRLTPVVGYALAEQGAALVRRALRRS